MTKAEDFIEWVMKTDPDFKQRDHGDIIAEYDPELEYCEEMGDCFYSDTTNLYFSDGSELILNYKGEVIDQWLKRTNI